MGRELLGTARDSAPVCLEGLEGRGGTVCVCVCVCVCLCVRERERERDGVGERGRRLLLWESRWEPLKGFELQVTRSDLGLTRITVTAVPRTD